jgi:hypothetical protein
MNFRKVVFALATAGLGLTGVASAQVTCTSAALSAGTTQFVRVEGTTELVPNVTVSGCTSGASITSATITVTTSAGVTNTVTTGAADAFATFFGGTAVAGTLSGNTLTFTATTAGGLGTTYGSGIVISGVRVNASSVPVATSITETAAAGPGIIFSGTAANAVPVAYTQQGMAKPVVQGFANKAICSAGTAVVPLLQAAISSGYSGAFMPYDSGNLFIGVVFANLAPGANYYVPASITAGTSLLNVTGATLVSSAAVPVTPVSGTVSIGPSGGTQVSGVIQLTPTNGAITAWYNLTGVTNAGIDAFIVPLYAVATSGATVGVTSAPTVMASFVSPTTGYDQFSNSQNQPVVSASSSATALTGLPFPTTVGGLTTTTGGGQLTSCATTLLFPYVVNSGGYDTGIALTNASAGTSVSQAGTCSVQFYGTGAPATNPYISDSVAAGGIAAFTLSSQAPGFQGYAIATCGFQDAHGFAFITDGYGSVGRGLSQGYLAIVTSAAGVSVSAPF